MNLSCGHDEEVGLVCALCAVEDQRALSAARAEAAAECAGCRELRGEISRLTSAGDEAVVRLGLVRRLAAVWNASGGPLAVYMARRLRTILDADADRLEALQKTKAVPEEEGAPEDADQSTAQVDEEDRRGIPPRRRRS